MYYKEGKLGDIEAFFFFSIMVANNLPHLIKLLCIAQPLSIPET